MEQLTLFSKISQTYLSSPTKVISNAELYATLESQYRVDFSQHEPIGKDGVSHNITKRKVRWYQQTLKQAGVIEKVGRGQWRLVSNAEKDELQPIDSTVMLLGFSTRLGAAVVASCEDFFSMAHVDIDLVFTSPPYPLANARRYGNPTEQEYVDWLCNALEPVVKNLVDGGSVCLNIGNDIFMPKSPARSLYQERLILALHDRFGLHKMDTFIWVANKAPTPVAWASKKRVQLNAGYEPIYWLTNNPNKVRSNNQRVLYRHSDEHHSFVSAGGVKKEAIHSDGSHRKVIGAYSSQTKGRIARNVQSFAMCHLDKNKEYKAFCNLHGLPTHGASMPINVASFFIEFLTEEQDLVVDPFGGRLKTAMAAENLNRRWLATERIPEYVLGAAGGFDLARIENHPFI